MLKSLLLWSSVLSSTLAVPVQETNVFGLKGLKPEVKHEERSMEANVFGLNKLKPGTHHEKRAKTFNYMPAATNASFDYVVVGGGTAGLTVAARLAENPKVTVAVIEAGDFYETVNGNLSIVPGYGGTVSTPAVDWGFQTTPQDALGGRKLTYNRGKAVGGSSATNLLAYHRGTTQSHDIWASRVGDDSYSFSGLQSYFQKSVKYSDGNLQYRAANATVPTPGSGCYSAAGGPLEIGISNWADPVSSYAGDAWKELGLSQLNDLTSGSLIGNQYSPASIKAADQTRSTSKSSFLQYALDSGRNNIFLFKTTMAKRITFDGTKAKSVIASTGGTTFELRAKKEIILSAGVFQSPQLLMVSGVGPKATLDKFNIPVVKNLPGVGQNMQDHLFFAMVYKMNVITGASMLDPTFATAAEAEYNNHHTGILTNTGADYFAWEKVPSSFNLSSAARSDLASFPADWPNYEVVIADLPFAPGANYGQGIGMLNSQTARGSITISSTDTADSPLINTQTLATATDREVAVAAVKLIPGPNVATDDQILTWLLANAGPGYHASCTCIMGKSSDPMAVVDTSFKVFGLSGLRVVDTSSFALLPPGHPLALVYALAEKAADLIKASA
ncbi:oxidoreductase [Cryomyces antarcticus]